MIRTTKLPLLPGNSFSKNVGKSYFPKFSHFEYLCKEIPYLTERKRTLMLPLENIDEFPSVYPKKEASPIPSWLAYDKQMLSFDGYVQEAMWEVHKSPFQIRLVKIYFYLEDGTIQVMEPKINNSGMMQGVLIRRQRINFPKPLDSSFYDVIDFNIGKNVEFYGRVFKIVNCDTFTRVFLNRMGIRVPDPLPVPSDPYREELQKKKDAILPKKPNTKVDKLGQFLSHDRHVLRFWAYWDNRGAAYGRIHKFKIEYYLADDTIEVTEIVPPNSGCDSGYPFVKRSKIPKHFDELPPPGSEEQSTKLNIRIDGFLTGCVLRDAVNVGYEPEVCYRDCDLAIGVALNIYGRKFVITDCDEYTKDYYRVKYGLEEFPKHPEPVDDRQEGLYAERIIPPWNGFGSHDSSMGNCLSVMPKEPKRDMVRLLTKDKVGLDSHMLRMIATKISKCPLDEGRLFLISHQLKDDKTQVFELAKRNSGFKGGQFARMRELFKPNQDFFVSKKPAIYTKEDFWIGNTLEVEGCKFYLREADEYTLRYMEINCNEFPKSNISLIMNKMKNRLRPQYKDFVCKYFRNCVDSITEGAPRDCSNCITFSELMTALRALMGNDITDHEIITVARHYRTQQQTTRWTKEEIKCIMRYECRKSLFYGVERLEENLRYLDICNTGYVPRKEARALMIGAKIPVDVDLIDTMIELADKNECGELCIDDMISFIDYSKYQVTPIVPINHKREFSELVKLAVKLDFSMVDCVCLLKNLGLEEELKQQ